MIASALEGLAQALLEEGKPLPVPSEGTQIHDADLIEAAQMHCHAGRLASCDRLARKICEQLGIPPMR